MPQAIPAIVGAGVGIYGANKQAKAAKQAAKATASNPYGVTGPAGSVTVDRNGRTINLSQGDNPFAQVFQALGLGSLGNAAAAPNQFLNGANPELAEAYKGLFGQGLTDRIQGNYDLLSQIAAPGEQRAKVGLEDQLFSMGQSGTSGGAEHFRALQEALSQADLQRQASAVGLGRQEALDRFTGASGAVQQGMAGQLQNYNIGAGSFGGLQQLFQNLLQQAGLGVGAGGGQAPGAAMYAAQAAGAPYQAGYQFLQNSGAFDALGRAIGGAFGAGGNSGGAYQPGVGGVGPYLPGG